MESEALDALLAKVNAGDDDALDALFAEYGPYLRMVVRRQLSPPVRAKFDSSDIVQSVWADVLDGLRETRWNFETGQQLRAFLVKVTRNRLVDRLRQHQSALKLEKGYANHEIDDLPATSMTRASEVVHAEDLWGLMLRACPAEHRELLHLKRKGASLAEIAERTGLHEGSVRRILYQIARDVARMQNRPLDRYDSTSPAP